MKRNRAWVLFAAWAATACAQAPAPPQPVPTQQKMVWDRPARHPSRGVRGAVAGGTEPSVEAGMRMLHAGGNAVDAGVASMFAAMVTEFSHFGFGGEAPILIRTKDGRVLSIAGIGTMPQSATADFFRGRRLRMGEIMDLEPNGLRAMVPVAGVMAAVVPGAIDAQLLALREFGTKSAAEVMAPALELADGMPLDEMRAGAISYSRRFFELWPDAMNMFMPGGKRPIIGEVFRQTDLARTMRAMIEAERKAKAAGQKREAAIDAVRDYFYRGEPARKIDAFMKANGGLLRYEDMAAFRLTVEEPVMGTYKGLKVYKPGFWSQGPVMIQALNLLEGIDLRSMRLNSTDYIHTVTEAFKLALADRDTYYGDPKFVTVPVAQLLSKEYAAERRQLIGPRASLEFRPGTVGDKPARHPSDSEAARVSLDDWLVSRDTTCVNVIDKDGIMFSATPSGASLPTIVAGDTGIAISNRAQSFYLVPGHANELAPGKRPRITLSPTVVLRNDKPYLALSTPGGDNQDQALVQLLLNVVEFGMDAQSATESPRLQTRHYVSSFDNHAMYPGDLLLDDRISPVTARELAGRGHKTQQRSKWSSGAAPVLIRVQLNNVIEAGADPFGYRNSQAW
ncbi:MAG: gamma-glutamyltransferase family protein [Acidobacteria bacterium]|nr:gamma-glutamyltransferase family protein [Acidobacteriota bacterium]